MGWFYTNNGSKASVIAEITEDAEHSDGDGVTGAIKHKQVYELGQTVLWVLHETRKNMKQPFLWIGCYLLDCRGGWGYKPMDESMYPYYFSCPLEYLNKAPEVCQKWRDGVREYHRQKQPA